jgi:hypothetical protein
VGHLCSVSVFEKGRYELETIVDDAFGLSFGIFRLYFIDVCEQ